MKLDKLRIPKGYDNRIKLTEIDKANIISLFNSGVGIREISRRYEKICSRRLIQFVIYPERLKKLRDTVKAEKRWLHYYDKGKNTLYARKHRAHKREALKQVATDIL